MRTKDHTSTMYKKNYKICQYLLSFFRRLGYFHIRNFYKKFESLFCFGLFHWRLRRAERTDSTKDLNFWHIWKWVKSKSHEYFWAPFLLHYMASYKKYVSYVMKSNTATKNWKRYFTIFMCIFFNGCIVSFCSSLSYQQNKKKENKCLQFCFVQVSE